jgi:TATA-box binding protein (TBP) (component of TFIID and TFIIIB)
LKIKIIFVVLLISFHHNYPCTTFIYRVENKVYFGRNLDWISGTGLIMTNQRNLEKISLVDQSEKPIKWVSKYGSITFNQVGKELPFGGMNEAGLVVEHMTLPGTEYPAKDERGALEPCQWIQFQLDNYSTVDEVMASDKIIRIIDSPSKFHFLVCDSSGKSVVIEFIKGKMICYTGENLPHNVLANSTYEESLEYMNDKKKTESDLSIKNFSNAAQMVSRAGAFSNSPVEYAFSILNTISQQPYFTKWSIVYDISDMKIYIKVFETPLIIGEHKIFRKQINECLFKKINVKEFSLECTHPSMVLDLEHEEEGEVNTAFKEYTTDFNKEFITKAFTFYKGWGIDIQLTDEQINNLARYPESFRCSK